VRTTFLLVRHAAHDWLGRGFAGRLAGVALNAQGRIEADALVGRLAGQRIDAICCSPQPRTQQTAQPLADARGLPVQVEPAFDEIDFGAWMGQNFDAVRQQDALWDHWVHRRGSAQPPGGEPFAGVPLRALAGLATLRQRYPGQHVLVVSHGDVLKAVVASVLGMSLDHLERFDISPASVTVLVQGEDRAKLLALNVTGQLPA
jgi:probable phosphoglycerate mutase